MKIPTGPVTTALAAITAVAFLLLSLGGWLAPAGVLAGFIPARLSGYVELGQGVPLWLTPLSATLVHANLLHVAFNLLMLFFCGRFVENALGGGLTAALYLVSAYAAALAQYALDPASTVPMVGASGAVSGLVGAYALFYGRRRAPGIGPLSSHAVQLLWLAAAWIVIQFMIELASFGSMQRVAVAAHVGGFLAGLLFARPMLLFRYRNA